MGIKKSQYSILVDVDLDTTRTQKKLNEQLKDLKVSVKEDGSLKKISNDAEKAAEKIKDLEKATKNNNLTFQAANEIFSKSVDIISSMLEQVYKLDHAIIE